MRENQTGGQMHHKMECTKKIMLVTNVKSVDNTIIKSVLLPYITQRSYITEA